MPASHGASCADARRSDDLRMPEWNFQFCAKSTFDYSEFTHDRRDIAFVPVNATDDKEYRFALSA